MILSGCGPMCLCSLSFVALVMGCSDFACPEGQARVEGMCVALPNGEIVDPPAKTQVVYLTCIDNLPGSSVSFLPWELTVDPEPIVSREPFEVSFRAIARFREHFLDLAQELIAGGARRVRVVHFQGTVHVRAGVVDTETSDVVLELGERPPPTCRYDASGAEEGPFPACDLVNDKPDGSNDDCTGLGGTHPDNPCGRYLDIDVSEDCAPGGRCDELGKLFQCDLNEFCVEGPLQATLEGSSSAYVAEASGSVFFGWDDQSTGAELDESGGPNDGTWILPPAVYEQNPGPNSARFEVGDLEVALECTMGVASQSPFVIQSVDGLSSPTPDYLLIRFPIQQR